MANYLVVFKQSFLLKLSTCFLLVVFADFLFYREAIGWTLGLFMFAGLGASLLHNRNVLLTRTGVILAGLTFLQCLLMVNSPEFLSLVLYALAMTSLLSISPDRWQGSGVHWLNIVLRFVSINFFRFALDIFDFQRVKSRKGEKHSLWNRISGWILPITFLIIFISLFSSANPIMQGWLEAIDLTVIWNLFSIPRIVFWLFIASMCWIVIRPHFKYRKANLLILEFQFSEKGNWLFSQQAVVRSLVMFNLLFALQTGMDFIYLWGAISLPEGMSYAEYAHRGAYPLVVTALLAGLFVVIACRPDSKEAQSPLLRGLVYFWVGQNILLVISAAWRTSLYVEVYSLTYLRVAAFIWMALVAIGLVLILFRINKNKTDLWLFNVNLMSLITVLMLCSFFNFSAIIAKYNVRHNYDVSGEAHTIDLRYIESLGPSALPALRWYIENNYTVNMQFDSSKDRRITAVDIERRLKNKALEEQADWHSWTYQNYRILTK